MVQLTLLSDSGDEVVLGMSPGGLAPEVVALGARLELEEVQLTEPGAPDEVTSRVLQRLVRRGDLGPHVWQVTYEVAGESTNWAPMLLVVTDDGVTISATRAAVVDELGVATGEPLSETDQLRIINSLRPLDYRGFLLQLERRGAELTGPNGSVTGGDETATTLAGG